MNIIEFPKLGLSFTIDKVAFRVLGLPIYWYGIIIAFGFLLVVIMAMRDCPKFNIEKDTIIDALLYATPVAIISARLFYVIFSLDTFRGNWKAMFDIRNGGLAIYGGIIGAFTVGYIFARKKKINVFALFDFAAPYFPLAQAIGRWGNFINQEAYGTHTDLPWGMTGSNIVNGPVHPTFLYESLWNFIAFFILIWYRNKKRNNGEVLYLYMVLYGAGRAWIEPLRTDSLMIGNLRANFLLAILFVIVFGILFIKSRRKDNEQPVEVGNSEYGAILQKIKEEEDQRFINNAESVDNLDSHIQEVTVGYESNDESFDDESHTDNGTDESKTE